MSTIVKIQKKGQVTIPNRLRTQAGLADGDLVEASFERGKIILKPQFVIDRSKFPTAAGDYTSAQRRVIDARLAESRDDFEKGRTYGPFETHEAMMAFLHGQLNKSGGKKNAKRKAR
jgi:AbrB family looped-hinge helix DNA binding protein